MSGIDTGHKRFLQKIQVNGLAWQKCSGDEEQEQFIPMLGSAEGIRFLFWNTNIVNLFCVSFFNVIGTVLCESECF